MPQFRRPSTIVFVIGFLASVVFKAKCELRVDGTKVLKRLGGHTSNGVAYANFAAHTFHYLNTTPLLSVSVNEFAECGKLCVDHFPCFSFNVAVFRDAERKIFCELLPSDKYNESSKFSSSQIFHHFSIKSGCSSHPCVNGATCVPCYESNEYHCACVAGYSGQSCEIDIDECSSNPCLNGGSCVDHLNGYTCSCLIGYTGVHCQTDIDECSSNPCLNGGSCIDHVNGYTCSCLVGYNGVHCQTDINECYSNPCLNGGTCVDGVNSFHCNCIAYFIGARCETIDVPDPIALYPLNAAYTSSDMMGNQPAGTTSNVQYAGGPDGTSQGSYQFWGHSNSYIELPNNGGLDIQYSMTMCMWVFPEGQDGPLFNYRPSRSWATHLFLAGDGKFFCRFTKRNDVMMDALVSPSALNTGQWSYVGCSYDYSTGLARAWVGEREVSTRYLEITSLSTAYNVRVGVKIDDSRYFRGRIARVQVYNIALNLGQFTAVKFRGAS